MGTNSSQHIRTINVIMATLTIMTMSIAIPVFPQARAIKAVGTRTTKYVEKKLLKKSSEKAIIMAAEKTSVKFGKHFAGRSIMEGAVKKAARTKVLKLVRKNGAKTFLGYGLRKADAAVKTTRLSVVKRTFATNVRHRAMRTEQKQMARRAEKHTEKQAQKQAQKATKKFLRLNGKAAAEYLVKKRPDLKPLIDKLDVHMLNNLVVERDGKKFILSITPQGDNQLWKNSKVIIEGNVIKGFGGSILADAGKKGLKGNPIDMGLNQFLNNLLPGKTYVVDNKFIYKTDKKGRIAYGKAFRKAPEKKVHGRGAEQKISKAKGGKEGKHDGGHIFSQECGGTQESVNIVPMDKEWQQGNGKWKGRSDSWRSLERKENEIVNDPKNRGKKIETERIIHYKGNSQVPVAITVIIRIDGKVVYKKKMSCP